MQDSLLYLRKEQKHYHKLPVLLGFSLGKESIRESDLYKNNSLFKRYQ